MARKRKEYRELTVCESSYMGRNAAPMIRIQGLWLEDLGFQIGDPVKVKCEDGKLIITLDTVKEDEQAAEKAFMESETKKLKERFLKEKQSICAAFVAEREARYRA